MPVTPKSVVPKDAPAADRDEPGWPRPPAAGASAAASSPQLLQRTFAMLSLFAADRPEWTTTELSSVSGLPVPTTHRIVVALQKHGFLVRDPATKRFRLGPAAIALGRAALSSADLQTAAGCCRDSPR